MRIVITALAAAVIAGLAASADAAPSAKKKRSAANTEQMQSDARTRDNTGEEYGYNNVPDHFRTGTADWWRAMDREGRGGCCGNP